VEVDFSIYQVISGVSPVLSSLSLPSGADTAAWASELTPKTVMRAVPTVLSRRGTCLPISARIKAVVICGEFPKLSHLLTHLQKLFFERHPLLQIAGSFLKRKLGVLIGGRGVLGDVAGPARSSVNNRGFMLRFMGPRGSFGGVLVLVEWH
jgi:hypothetical protein